MDTLKKLFAAIAAVLAAIFFFNRNKQLNEHALSENKEVKNKVSEIDKKIEETNVNLKTEEDKRIVIENEAKKEKEKDVSTEDLTNFFNSRNK